MKKKMQDYERMLTLRGHFDANFEQAQNNIQRNPQVVPNQVQQIGSNLEQININNEAYNREAVLALESLRTATKKYVDTDRDTRAIKASAAQLVNNLAAVGLVDVSIPMEDVNGPLVEQ